MPVIVDAGVGTASDAAIAMELGVDGVLMNTAIAGAGDPVRMAAGDEARRRGRPARLLAGRIPQRRHASASSPTEGLVTPGAGRAELTWPAKPERAPAGSLTRLERERDGGGPRSTTTRSPRSIAASSRPAPMPDPPPPYDTTKLPAVNEPGTSSRPARRRSTARSRAGCAASSGGWSARRSRRQRALQRRARRSPEPQRRGARRGARRRARTTIAVLRQQADALARFQAHLIQYLQTITLYVDTKDRAVGGRRRSSTPALERDHRRLAEALGVARRARAALPGRAMARGRVDDLRATATLAQQTALSLKREVERLLAATPRVEHRGSDAIRRARRLRHRRSPDLDAFKYLGFEDAFRGSTDEIRARLADVPAAVRRARPTCSTSAAGAASFSTCSAQRGISARGLDLNHEMVEDCRARAASTSPKATRSAISQSLPDESLGGLFAAQVVEHLAPDYLMRLLEAAAPQDPPGRPHRPRDHQPGVLAGVLRELTFATSRTSGRCTRRRCSTLRVERLHATSTIEYKSPVAEAVAAADRCRGPTDGLRRHSSIWSRPSTRTSRSSTRGCSRSRTTPSSARK